MSDDVPGRSQIESGHRILVAAREGRLSVRKKELVGEQGCGESTERTDLEVTEILETQRRTTIREQGHRSTYKYFEVEANRGTKTMDVIRD